MKENIFVKNIKNEKNVFSSIDHAKEVMDTIFETLGAARWTIYCDEVGQVERVAWSNELRNLLGYDEVELPDTLEASYPLVHPDDFDHVYEELASVLQDQKGDRTFDLEYRLKLKTGEYRWFRTVGKYAADDLKNGIRTCYGVIVNIHEQKKHETRIQENLRVMSVLNKEYTAVYFVDLDQDKYTSYFNEGNLHESASKIVQSHGIYTKTMADCILSLVAEEDRGWLSKMVDPEVLKKRLETENEFVIRYRVSDNFSGQNYFEMRFVSCSNTPDKHQVIIGFHCIDETLKKEAEMKQKLESKHRKEDYQKLLVLHHALRSSMWGFDFDEKGMILNTDFSEAFCTMMGFEDEDFPVDIDKCFDRVCEEDREKIRNAAMDILKHPDEDRQYNGECRVQSQQGDLRWFHISGKVFPKGKHHFSFIAVLTDIHEEKSLRITLSQEVIQLEKTRDKLKKALWESNLNNEIISAIGKIYWLIYRIDLVSGTYEEVSSGEKIHRLTGKHGNLEDIFKEAENTIVSKEYRTVMTKFFDVSTLNQRLQEEETITAEYLSTNGTWHQARFIAKRRDEFGNVKTALYVVSEIDEQKQKELDYQRRLKESAEEAEKANIAKTDFLRRMSHDIRTPINGIRGMVEIENHHSDNVEKLKECREKIWEASGYLLSLVNNVLDMNKLESGDILLEEEPFDICKLLDETKTLLEIQATEYGVTFIMHPFHDIKHQYLLGSPTYLKQILMNLANNALKYNHEGGEVSISCKELYCNDTTAVFQFVCSDTGIGMSEDFQKHAFEAFSQEKKDARSTFTGSGLGLSITKNLVEYMNGTIKLFSKENVGTTFIVTIPIKIGSCPLGEEAMEDVQISGKRVLLVEDNLLNMEIAKFMLENHGLIVEPVSNGKEAIQVLESSPTGYFDAVFMDIMMPVMGGLEATKYIRAMESEDIKNIPIFAMTANAFKDDIQASLHAGMNEHLIKPLDEGKIISTLRKYLVNK